MIEQAARCGHQDIDTAAQSLNLRINLHSAEDHCGLHRQVLTIGDHALLDLGGELAGGGQNQGTHRARSLAVVTAGQSLEQRLGKACCLTGTGLGAGHNIPALENDGYGLTLYRCRLAITFFFDSTQDIGRKAE